LSVPDVTATTIAIDGPVASGKTTVGRALARRMGYRFVDTGLMYRAVTVEVLARGVRPDDADAVSAIAETIAIQIEDDGEQVTVDGRLVTAELRSESVGWGVSFVARAPRVRRALVARQREMAAGGGVVMVGRDIGTVVLPSATKMYLHASPEVRAERRRAELAASGSGVSERDVRAELELRDTLDSERGDSPLRTAQDAVVIDTEGLGVESVVDRIVEALAG
jgi:cytidylate kinase